MKPKTAFQLIFIGIAVFLPAYFVLDPENQAIFAQEFSFMGYSFSVLKGLVGAIITSAVLPSLYFTNVYRKLAKTKKSLIKDQKSNEKQLQWRNELPNLLDHGAYDAVLDRVGDDVSAFALSVKAEALIAKGEGKEAIPLLRQIYEEDGQVRAAYLLAEQLYAIGESPRDPLHILIRNEPKLAVKAHRLLLKYFDSKKLWQECLDVLDDLETAGQEVPVDVRAGYRFEMIRSNHELTSKQAIDGYQKIVKSAPDFVPARLLLGDTHMSVGAVEKAFSVYEKAYNHTKNPVFLGRLEQFYLEQGRPEDAIQIYRELKVKTGDLVVKYQLAKLYLKLEMLDESLEIFDPLEPIMSEIPGFYCDLAEIKARRGRMHDALEDLKRLIKQQGFDGEDHVCSNCNELYHHWQPRCQACGEWNTVTLQVSLAQQQNLTHLPIVY